MKNKLKVFTVLLIALSFTAVSPAFAKKDGDPAGWSKGEKKGWHGESTPPGFSKRDAAKAKKDAHKQAEGAADAAKKATE
jgi:hypothetical protein